MQESQAPSLQFNKEAHVFASKLLSSWKQRLFLFFKLPAAWFMGVRVESMSPEAAKVHLRYRWRSQNPFKSVYFAAQAAAAELSTGVLCMAHIQGKGKVSMLVKDMQADFEKKGTGLVEFVCQDGAKIAQAVDEAIATGEGRTVTVESIGRQKDEQGQYFVVSRFSFTWTFKAKKK